MQQWGVSTKDINTYTINVIYAKQFELFCRPIAIPYLANTSIDSSARLAISSVTNSKFIFMTDTSSITTQAIWFVAGVQQWRMLEIEATEQNVLFPIPFIQWCVASGSRVTGTGGNPTTLGANAAFHQIATLTHAAVFSVEAQEYYLFAAGVQQWGYYFESQSDADYRYLPITYTTHYCVALGNITYAPNESETGYAPYYQEVSNSVFLVGLGNNRIGNANVPVITVGIQQWGLQDFPTLKQNDCEADVKLAFAMNQTNYFVISGVKTRGPRADNIGGGLFSYAEIVDANTIHLTCDYKTNFSGSTSAGIWFLVIAQQWGYIESVSGQLQQKIVLNIESSFYTFYATSFSVQPEKISVSHSQGSNLYIYHEINRGAFWFFIGKQQWGYITESSSATDYRLFPVSFTTECFAVCTGSSQRQDNVSVWVNEIDTIKFIVGIGENYTAMPQKNIFYIACGKQQWGYSPYNAEDGLVSIALQLSSSEIISVCSQQIARSATDKNGTQQVLFVSFDETTINFRIVNTEASTDTAISFYWFGLFKQQWGSYPLGNNNIIIGYTTWAIAISQDAANSGAGETLGLSMLTLSSIRLTRNPTSTSGTYPVFVVGIQQWGYEITFTAKTIVFPCPYAEIIPSVIGASSGSSAKLAINANSLTSFNASNQAAQTIWWIAIGKQQWGIMDFGSYASQQTCSLSLSFSNFNFVFFPIDYGYARPFCINEKTLLNVTISSEPSSDFKTIFWLDIGI